MNSHGRPVRVGQIACQAGTIATAVKTKDGLRWQVRHERDGLTQPPHCLAHTSHWRLT
jgi:hypothetical protein